MTEKHKFISQMSTTHHSLQKKTIIGEWWEGKSVILNERWMGLTQVL